MLENTDVETTALIEERKEFDVIDTNNITIENENNEDSNFQNHTSYCGLFKDILLHTAPLILDNIIVTSSGFGDAILIKKMGNDVIAAAAYVSPVKSLLIYPASAMFTAMQPFVSKSSSKGKFAKIGELWRHSITLGFCSSAVIVTFLIPLEPFLNAVGQDTKISALTAEYFHYYMFATPAIFAIESTIQFWISAEMQYLVIPASIIRSILQLTLTSAFTYGTSLGVKGWGLANMLQPWISLGIFLFYMRLDKRFEKFKLFDSNFEGETFRSCINKVLINFKKLIKIGLPTSLNLLSVFGAKMINVLLLGASSKESLSAYYIASQYSNWVIMILSPLATTGCVLISRAIGSGKSYIIKRIECIALLTGISLSLSTLPFFCTLQKPLTTFLLNTNENDVEKILLSAQTIMPVVGASDISFSVKYIATGLFRGYKETIFPSLIGIIGTLVFGLGISALFHFFSSENWGVPMGELIGLTCAAIILLIFLQMRKPVLQTNKMPTADLYKNIGFFNSKNSLTEQRETLTILNTESQEERADNIKNIRISSGPWN